LLDSQESSPLFELKIVAIRGKHTANLNFLKIPLLLVFHSLLIGKGKRHNIALISVFFVVKLFSLQIPQYFRYSIKIGGRTAIEISPLYDKLSARFEQNSGAQRYLVTLLSTYHKESVPYLLCIGNYVPGSTLSPQICLVGTKIITGSNPSDFYPRYDLKMILV
jgi:hypothetical protein